MHARTLCIVLLCVFGIAAAFALRPSRITRRSVIDTQLFGLGDMLKGAFANDPSLPPPKNAGLSSEPISVEIEFLPSKKVVKALLGSKISDIAKVNNIAIRYSCKKGECATCEVNFNGKIVKACQATLPSVSSIKRFQIGIPDKPVGKAK